MGRRRDTPETQAAKGFPGRRRTKVEKQIATAEALATSLAAAPAESADRLAPPAMLTDPRSAAALTVWRDLAPKLTKLNLLSELDRYTFAMFCIYVGEFHEAQNDILANGYSKNVRTVSGDLMPRRNPSVYRRDKAQAIVEGMAVKFGLTPLDYQKLIGLQAAQGPSGGLFGQAAPGKPDADAPIAPAPVDDGPIGLLGRFDSAPPAARAN